MHELLLVLLSPEDSAKLAKIIVKSMWFLDFPNRAATQEHWDFCGLGMSAGSRGATLLWCRGTILSMKKLIAAQWMARNLQGGCGWEFPWVWSSGILLSWLQTEFWTSYSSFRKKGHIKITGKVGALVFFCLFFFKLFGIRGFIAP